MSQNLLALSVLSVAFIAPSESKANELEAEAAVFAEVIDLAELTVTGESSATIDLEAFSNAERIRQDLTNFGDNVMPSRDRVLYLEEGATIYNVENLADLVKAARDVVDSELVSSITHNPDWSIRPAEITVLSSKLAVLKFRQFFGGIPLSSAGDIRVVFESQIGFSMHEALVNLPRDVRLKRISGIVLPDLYIRGSLDVDANTARDLVCSEFQHESTSGCDVVEITHFIDPYKAQHAYRVRLSDGRFGNVFGENVVERGGADNNGWTKGSVRQLLHDSTTNWTIYDDGYRDTWVSYENQTSSTCRAFLGLEGAVHSIQRVENGSSPYLEAYDNNLTCPPTTGTVLFNHGCSGNNCLGDYMFRQQTVYSWVKNSRDRARQAFDNSATPPVFSTSVSIEVDAPWYSCATVGNACYSSYSQRLYFKWPTSAGGEISHFMPDTVGHEYGHHFASAYYRSDDLNCNQYTDARSIREGIADLFSLIVMRNRAPNIEYSSATNRFGGDHDISNGKSVEPHTGPTNRLVYMPGCVFDYYSTANAFEQAWFEILNDFDCHQSSSECLSQVDGDFNGSTASGIGWPSRAVAERDVLRAIAIALVTEGSDTTWPSFSHAMEVALATLGYNLAFRSNVDSVLDHHNL